MSFKSFFNFVLIALLCSFSVTSFAKDARKYKCVAIYNHGEEWPLDNIVYYIEFDYNKLTRWELRDGEWKNGKVFELCNEYDDGTKVYVNKENITTGVTTIMMDWFRVSPDYSSIYRSYRGSYSSEYEFDYVFQKIE